MRCSLGIYLTRMWHIQNSLPTLANNNWVMESGEHLLFPSNQSENKGGMLHYLEFIEELNVQY